MGQENERAINTQLKNDLLIKVSISIFWAPKTFLTPTSFSRLSQVYLISPIKPITDITILRKVKKEIILKMFLSPRYWELKY